MGGWGLFDCILGVDCGQFVVLFQVGDCLVDFVQVCFVQLLVVQYQVYGLFVMVVGLLYQWEVDLVGLFLKVECIVEDEVGLFGLQYFYFLLVCWVVYEEVGFVQCWLSGFECFVEFVCVDVQQLYVFFQYVVEVFECVD